MSSPDAPLTPMRVMTDDSRAAAEVLEAGDPELVARGPSLTTKILASTDKVMGVVMGPVELVAARVGVWAHGHPLVARIWQRYKRMSDEAFRQRAALAASGAAFWIIISIFPATIAAVNVFGLFLEPAQVVAAMDGMTNSYSGTFGDQLEAQLLQVAAASNRSLSIGLAVSVVLSLWSVSAGLAALTRAIRQAYGLRPLTFLEIRRRSMLSAVFVVLMFGLGATFTAIEAWVIEWSDRVWVGVAAFMLDLPVTILFVAFLVTAMYRMAIGRRIRWKPLIPGVVFATVGLVALAVGYSLVLDLMLTRYTSVYGAIAGTVLALLLAYFAVYVVVLGAIINAQHLADQRDRFAPSLPDAPAQERSVPAQRPGEPTADPDPDPDPVPADSRLQSQP